MVPGGHTCLSAGGSPTGAPLEAVWAQVAITPPPFTSERHWWSYHLHNLTAARAPTHGFPVGGGCPSLTPGSACLQPLLIVAFLLEQHLRALPEPGSVGTNASGSAHKRSASDGIVSFIHCTAGPGRVSHLKAMPYTSSSLLAEEPLEGTSAVAGVEQHGSDLAAWRSGVMVGSRPARPHATMISDRPLH